jgi:OHCU decarboxylase
LYDAIEQLNSLSEDEARHELLKCCGSDNWAQRMVAERPFVDVADLLGRAERIWWSLDAEDWLAAFRSHPRIGEQKAAEKVTEQAQKWSEHEQAGTRDAASETKQALAAGNVEYHQRFGFIFIVCASGKTADEMLAVLKARLNNDSAKELRVAAEEQRKITHLRLKKLITDLCLGS